MKLLPLLALCAATALAQQDGWRVTSSSTYTLPSIPLADAIRDSIGVEADDRGVRLGGVGSGLWNGPGDGPNVFWMITDRGPNGQIPVSGANRRTFPVPEFTPLIVKVQTGRRGLRILDMLPISGVGPALGGISGLSNTSRDERPYGCNAQTELPFNPHGLDTEGIVRTRDGNFWVVDEYSPSIIKIDPTGKVLKRFVPRNLTPPTVTEGYNTIAVLPDIYTRRKANRGFEDVTLSPDGRMLYVALQSPLSNPTAAVGDPSRNTRIIAFDTQTEQVTAEYLYRFQPVAEFNDTRPTEMKVSGLAMLNDTQMLVLERTDLIAKIYRVDLTGATNIFNTRWDTLTTDPSLEALNDAQITANQITPLSKELVLTLNSAKGYPLKIEGVTVLNSRTIAIANDNDFGVGDFEITPGNCRLVDTNNPSQLLVLRLDRPLDR